MYRTSPQPNREATTTAVAESVPAPDNQRLQLLKSLLGDPAWECPDTTRQRLQQVLAVLDAGPAAQANAPGPVTSEADWRLLAHELECYLDFRRLRHLEADYRGCADTDFPFDRQAWARAHEVERTLADYHRHVREESFVTPPPEHDLFRIH